MLHLLSELCSRNFLDTEKLQIRMKNSLKHVSLYDNPVSATLSVLSLDLLEIFKTREYLVYWGL